MSEWIRKPKYKDRKNKRRNRNKSIYYPRAMEEIDHSSPIDINKITNEGDTDSSNEIAAYGFPAKKKEIKNAKKNQIKLEFPTEYYLKKYAQEAESKGQINTVQFQASKSKNSKINSEKSFGKLKYDKDKNLNVLAHKNLLKEYLKKVESGSMKAEDLDKILNQKPAVPEEVSVKSTEIEKEKIDYFGPECFEEEKTETPLAVQEKVEYDYFSSSDDNENDDTYYNLLVQDLDINGLE